jgi:alcohol dehydrogenase
MIKDFILEPKTKIIFGKDTHKKVGEHVKHYGKKCLLHYDGGDYLEPILQDVKHSLKQANIEIFELGGVLPNPRFSLILKGIELCRHEDIDFVLALGGGSVMDSAKFIAFGKNAEFDIWTYKSFTPYAHSILPHGAISTLPGTGSELSSASMILNDMLPSPVKGHFTHPSFRFDFAIINPELSYTLPAKQVAAGAMDTISHAMEGYFSNTENAYLLKGYMENIITSVMTNLKCALKNPTNYDARANLWIASLMPMEHYVISSTQPDWVVHNIEKPLTAMFNGTHGYNLAILTIAWMKYVYKRDVPQFVRWAVNVMGVKEDYYHPEVTVREGIQRFEDFLKSVGLPTRLSEVGIAEDAFEAAAELALKVAGFEGREGTIGMISKLTFDDMQEVYKLAR